MTTVICLLSNRHFQTVAESQVKAWGQKLRSWEPRNGENK